MLKIGFFIMVFNVFMACGASSVNSGDDETGTDDLPAEGEAREEDEEPTGSREPDEGGSTLGSGAGTTGAKPSSSTPPQATGPCAKYPLNCGADIKLCGEKYLHCLVPQAGSPAETQTVVCKKEGETTLTLVVNTWNAPAGQNQLLCDYWENTQLEEQLWLFATRQKGICQQEMNRKKQELSAESYQCE